MEERASRAVGTPDRAGGAADGLRDTLNELEARADLMMEEAARRLEGGAERIDSVAGRRVRELATTARGGGPDDGLRSAFLSRYGDFLERLAASASNESMQTALAASDEVGGLAGILASVGPIDPPPRDPLASARARGAVMKSDLLARAGGALSAGEVAALMGVTPAAVHARRQRGTLLAVRQANGEFLYPACQFGDEGALPGLGQVLAAFTVDGEWTRLSVLLSPAPALDGATPLDALRRGDVAGAVEAVSSYGEHGG